MSPWLSGMPSRSLRPTQGHGVAVFQAQSLQRGADLGVGLVDADHDRALGHAPGRHASETRQGPCAPRCSVRWRRPRWCRSAPDGGAADVDAGEVRSRCEARPQARRRRRDGPEAAALVGPNQQRRPVEHLPARFGVCRHAMAGRRRTALGQDRRRLVFEGAPALVAPRRYGRAHGDGQRAPSGWPLLRWAAANCELRALSWHRPRPSRVRRRPRDQGRRGDSAAATEPRQGGHNAASHAPRTKLGPPSEKRQRGRPCRIRGAQAEGRQKRRRRPT